MKIIKYLKNKKVRLILVLILLATGLAASSIVYVNKDKGKVKDQTKQSTQPPTKEAPKIDPFANTPLEKERKEVASPSGNNKALLAGTDESSGDLKVNDKLIAPNIVHFQWDDDNTIFYIQYQDSNSTLNKIDITNNITTKLVEIPGELMGFEQMKTSLVYTSESKVGFIKKDGRNHIEIRKFNSPNMPRDTSYVPNIVASEDKESVTVELLDEKYLDNKKRHFIVIDDDGVIQSTSEYIEE